MQNSAKTMTTDDSREFSHVNLRFSVNNNNNNKAIVDIRLCPHSAIPPTPSWLIGHIACTQKFSEYYLHLPGILNDPFCCMTLLAIE